MMIGIKVKRDAEDVTNASIFAMLKKDVSLGILIDERNVMHIMRLVITANEEIIMALVVLGLFNKR